MSLLLPNGYHWDEKLMQGHETAELTSLVWPAYIIEDSDIHEPGLKIEMTEQEFVRRFPVWGIRRDDNRELVAYANAVQIAADLAAKTLPDDGWSFAIRSASTSDRPNCLCLLVANVKPSARGLGFAETLIERAKLATTELGFRVMIAPVRPTLKSQFPRVPMADYAARKSDAGQIFDPWLRVHAKSGGQILNVCETSTRVRASLPKWRQWTGLPLFNSGEEILSEGLAPLSVDVAGNVGVYIEAGVWVRYDL